MMIAQASATPDYTSGFSEPYIRYLTRRTAETNAAYLLPYLRPGLRVLDFGCGPGSISVGLAKAVEPGEMHGVDMEETQIELARSVAEASGCENAIFHVADATSLPFEDGFFDVAHCHSVLSYIPDTRAALSEAKRVLKPGGVIGCREFISDSSFIYPSFGILQNTWRIFEDLLAADDGHPDMGKEMKGYMQEAGFTDIQATASFDVYSAPEDLAFVYDFFKQWFLSPEITEAAIKYAASTQELRDSMNIAFDEWKGHSEAMVALATGEVIARKPQS